MMPATHSQSELWAILPVINHLEVNNRIRKLAESYIEGNENKTVKPLIRSLRAKAIYGWRERTVSAWLLGHSVIEPNQRGEALTVLLRALKPRSIPYLIARMGCVMFISIFVILALKGLGLIIFAGAMCWCMISSGYAVREFAAVALGYLQFREAVRPLVRAAFERDARVRSGATFALRSILPTYTQEDYGTVDRETMIAIARLLAHPDIYLAFCSLDALALVGGSSTIPYVERVTRSETTPELLDAAREVLAILRERQTVENQRATLLRPSQPEDHETLLRPASNAPDDERLLLKPSEKDHP